MILLIKKQNLISEPTKKACATRGWRKKTCYEKGLLRKNQIESCSKLCWKCALVDKFQIWKTGNANVLKFLELVKLEQSFRTLKIQKNVGSEQKILIWKL